MHINNVNRKIKVTIGIVNALFFLLQKKAILGIKEIATKLDWKLGFPIVPIIPLVCVRQSNISNPKY